MPEYITMPEYIANVLPGSSIAFGPALFVERSSNIKALQHSAQANILRVAFKSGATYLYFGVPETLFLEARDEEGSVGKWLNDEIKPKYPCLKEGLYVL